MHIVFCVAWCSGVLLTLCVCHFSTELFLTFKNPGSLWFKSGKCQLIKFLFRVVESVCLHPGVCVSDVLAPHHCRQLTLPLADVLCV